MQEKLISTLLQSRFSLGRTGYSTSGNVVSQLLSSTLHTSFININQPSTVFTSFSRPYTVENKFSYRRTFQHSLTLSTRKFSNGSGDGKSWWRDKIKDGIFAGAFTLLGALTGVATLIPESWTKERERKIRRAIGTDALEVEARNIAPIPRDHTHLIKRRRTVANLEKEFLSIKNDNGIGEILITGVEGAGKSELAEEFAENYAEKIAITLPECVRTIKVFRAENPDDLQKQYMNFAKELGIAAQDLGDGALIRKVHDALKDRPYWLLVFDNAKSVDDKSIYDSIKDYIPKDNGYKGRVIITSRDSTNLPDDKQYTVKVIDAGSSEYRFSKDEVNQLIDKNLGKDHKEYGKKREKKERLGKTLGYLPNAVRKAAAYIKYKGNQESIESYSDLIREKLELQEGVYPDCKKEHVKINNTVNKLAIESAATNQSVIDILSFVCLLNPDIIQEDLLKKKLNVGKKKTGQAQSNLVSESEFITALELLTTLSLLEEKGNNEFKLHRSMITSIKECIPELLWLNERLAERITEAAVKSYKEQKIKELQQVAEKEPKESQEYSGNTKLLGFKVPHSGHYTLTNQKQSAEERYDTEEFIEKVKNELKAKDKDQNLNNDKAKYKQDCKTEQEQKFTEKQLQDVIAFIKNNFKRDNTSEKVRENNSMFIAHIEVVEAQQASKVNSNNCYFKVATASHYMMTGKSIKAREVLEENKSSIERLAKEFLQDAEKTKLEQLDARLYRTQWCILDPVRLKTEDDILSEQIHLIYNGLQNSGNLGLLTIYAQTLYHLGRTYFDIGGDKNIHYYHLRQAVAMRSLIDNERQNDVNLEEIDKKYNEDDLDSMLMVRNGILEFRRKTQEAENIKDLIPEYNKLYNQTPADSRNQWSCRSEQFRVNQKIATSKHGAEKTKACTEAVRAMYDGYVVGVIDQNGNIDKGKILSYLQKSNDTRKAKYMNDVGNLLSVMGKPQEAIECFKAAIKFEQERGTLSVELAESHLGIAKLLQRTEPKLAELVVRKCLEIENNIGMSKNHELRNETEALGISLDKTKIEREQISMCL